MTFTPRVHNYFLLKEEVAPLHLYDKEISGYISQLLCLINDRFMKTLLTLISVLGITRMVTAQEPSEQLQRMNTIKFEISRVIYPNSYIFSYERVTTPYQTFCITGGYEEFPHIYDVSSTINVKRDINSSGFKAGAEYRFYLKNENKYLATRGVYIGPYISYHDFYNNREIEVDVDGIKETALLKTDFSIFNVGFQLGYQFVISNRLTLDFVLVGPSISNYRANMKMEGDFTFDKEDVENEILLKMLDRFPMLDELLTNIEVTSQGTFDRWSYGWRYQFLIGYHFGKKKKH